MAPRFDAARQERTDKRHWPWTGTTKPIGLNEPFPTVASTLDHSENPDPDDHYTNTIQSTSSWTDRPLPSTPSPSWPSKYSSQDTSYTSTTTFGHHTKYPETVPTTTQADSGGPAISTFTATDGPVASPADSSDGDQSSHVPIYAAASAVPIIMLALIAFAVFFCMRKRRKQKEIAAAQMKVQEMKASRRPLVHAYVSPATPVSRAPSYTSTPGNVQPRSLATPPPVILGPISSETSGNYMTGIDTSDVVSTRNDRTGLGDPFADSSSLSEEPPPPYRPRSLASRTTSVRMPRSSMSMSSQNSHIQRQPLRNPFEDPREDDVVSDLSGPTLNRDVDNMSAVSDRSYQQDPVVGRRG